MLKDDAQHFTLSISPPPTLQSGHVTGVSCTPAVPLAPGSRMSRARFLPVFCAQSALSGDGAVTQERGRGGVTYYTNTNGVPPSIPMSG